MQTKQKHTQKQSYKTHPLLAETRDVNRLSIIRNSIEKNDYRLQIDVID